MDQRLIPHGQRFLSSISNETHRIFILGAFASRYKANARFSKDTVPIGNGALPQLWQNVAKQLRLCGLSSHLDYTTAHESPAGRKPGKTAALQRKIKQGCGETCGRRYFMVS